ncbi:glycosyltransferase [Pseudolabrys sp. FHR47]|uniref:glycosyltransferase n=1 Tax=Pseudolabrys sp. FHR47 TaxID=2562284 RepID=UPI0010BEAA61|nr:glycosyltransferase [Pseudolabrys sp. FHR47]
MRLDPGERAPGRSRAARARTPGREPLTAFPGGLPSAHAGYTGDHPELDCVRRLLPAATLAWAALRADRLGIGADRTLITARAMEEESYVRALASDLGIDFEPLDDKIRADSPLDDRTLVAKAAGGLLSLTDESGAPFVVVAPRGLAARGLIRLIRRDPAYAARLRLTTSERMNRFVVRVGGPALVSAATSNLAARWPALAAKGHFGRNGLAVLTTMAALLTGAAVAAPALTQMTIELLLSAAFLAWLGLRLTGAFVGERPPPPDRLLPDSALPVYTVVAALYREARSVAGLLAAIERLDYPPEKLDIIIAVEADDRDTRAALAATRTKFPITVIPVPPQGPRTKPKALNVALPFARGTYTVIYDAEDRPDPGQLRRALQAFLAGPADLACVQARLCIDNTDDSWLTGYYTAEYTGQFDVFMPGLAALGLPLPLGGSSNHFHTETLRKAGAWDPFNVTEDADLGMRLARFGYRTGMIRSTTYEEAPARIGAWLRQRTRWFKGWMQTWLVHMREPVALLRQLGPAGFAAFHLMVGGNVLGALVHPLFVVALISGAFQSADTSNGDHVSTVLFPLYGATAVFGYLSSAAIGWLGLSRRGLRSSAWVLALTPLHWVLLSVAAWRALYQLFTTPFAWEKTEHGLARSSRRAVRLSKALADLDSDLRLAKDSGRLPTINAVATGTSADRRPPRRASA